METCAIEECQQPVFCRGWCSKHYSRWQRGQPLDGLSQYEKSLHERFWEKVDASSDCWVWTGFRESKGYGYFRVRNVGSTVVMKAHRWAWEEAHGPIPDGLTIDHVVCANTSCVRPAHMEVVTRAENTRRARARQRAMSS